jgi:hypothetical protein
MPLVKILASKALGLLDLFDEIAEMFEGSRSDFILDSVEHSVENALFLRNSESSSDCADHRLFDIHAPTKLGFRSNAYGNPMYDVPQFD